jgi:hypothetical protein
MSDAPLSQTDREKRITDLRAKITQAVGDLGVIIRTNPTEERLLTQLELLAELIQAHWILLDIARGKTKSPE